MPASRPDRCARWTPWLLLALAAGLVPFMVTGPDADVLSHLHVGRWILEHGRLPAVHPGSAYTGPLLPHTWLYQVLLALTWEVGGLPATLGLGTLVIVSAHVLAVDRLGGSLPDGWRAALVVLMVAATLPRWTVRPHLATWLLLPLWTSWLLESRTPRHGRALVLGALWASLHGGYVAALGLGVVTAAAALLDRDRPTARARGTLLGAFALGTFVHPHGPAHLLDVVGHVGNGPLVRQIVEFQPAWPAGPGTALSLVVLAVVPALLLGARRRPPGRWLAATSLWILALTARRFVALAGLVSVPLALSAAAPIGDARRRPTCRRWAMLLATVTALQVAFALPGPWPWTLPDTPSDRLARSLPAGTGTVFAPIEWGGTILHRAPDLTVWIDGLAYDESRLDRYNRIRNATGPWRHALAADSVRAVLVPASLPLADSLAAADGWRLAGDDGPARLYVTEP